MKYSAILLIASTCGADAWSMQPHGTVRKEGSVTTTEPAQQQSAGGWVAAAVFAGALATAPLTALAVPSVEFSTLPESSSMLVAAGAYQAEDSYFSTDLSMPSYTNENAADLVGQPAGKEQKATTAKAPKAGKAETPKRKATREANEAKAAIKAEENEVALRAKKTAEFDRLQNDLKKIAEKKAERTAMQQKRNAN